MPKQILFSDEGRAALLRGVSIMASAVKATMGPKGRNVVIDKKFGSPTITKDGVTVAKEIELKDNYEDMGAQMLKEVASKTSDIAGDGTTTATVLAHAIIRDGLKNVTAGANPMGLKRGIDTAVEAVVNELKKMSKSTKDKKEIEQVASIASNNDKTIGSLIAEAMEKVGKDGVITVEESKSADTALDVVEGMQFDRLQCTLIESFSGEVCVVRPGFKKKFDQGLPEAKKFVDDQGWDISIFIIKGSPILRQMMT